MENNISLKEYINRLDAIQSTDRLDKMIIAVPEWNDNISSDNVPDWYKALWHNSVSNGQINSFMRTYLKRFYGSFTVTDFEKRYLDPQATNLFMAEHFANSRDFATFFDYKLGKEFESMFFEYNPLENYNGEETETIHDIGSGTDNNTKTGSVDSTNSGDDKLTIKNNQSKTTANSGSDVVAMKNNQSKTIDNSGDDVVTTKNNQHETVTLGGTDVRTTENKQIETTTNSGMDITDNKNNQSVTNSHSITSYASNEIDSTTTSYSGDADEQTVTHGLTVTHEYDGEPNEERTSYGQTTTTAFTGDADEQTTTHGLSTTESYSGAADEQTTTHGLSTTESYSGTADEQTTTHGLKNVTTYNNVVDNGTNTHNNTITRTLTKKGNLGVTTSQQMLKSERTDAATFSFWQMLADMYVAFICDYV